MEITLENVSYDPNYVEDEDDEQEEKNESDEDDEYDEEVDDPSEEVDDESWKLRKTSAKILSAILSTTTDPNTIFSLSQKIGTTITKRLSERTEEVRIDIYSTFNSLLKQLQKINSSKNNDLSSEQTNKLLFEWIPLITKHLLKQFSSSSPKTKIACFSLLKELISTYSSILDNHLKDLINQILLYVDEKKNLLLKIEAISFVELLFTLSKPKLLIPYVEKISQPIFDSVGCTNLQAAQEALKVIYFFSSKKKFKI